MTTPTYDLINSQILGSNATSVTFTSISSSYKDLILVADYGSTGTNINTSIRFNSDSTGSYYYYIMSGSSFGVNTERQYANDRLGVAERANPDTGERGLTIAQIMDYSSNDKHKNVLARSNSGTDGVDAFVGRWEKNDAIHTILVYSVSQQFAAGSTFYLYGIAS